MRERAFKRLWDRIMITRRTGIISMVLAWSMIIGFCLSTLPLSFNGERPNDFPNYYFAGLRLFEERPIYEPLEKEVFRHLGFTNYPTNIADSPATVVLLSPLSQMSYRVAFFTLYLFSLVSVPLLVYFIGRYLGFGIWESVCASSLILFSNHYRFLLLCNHMESILLLCLTLGWVALRQGKERTGGALWGLGTALKLFPGLLIVMLALSGRKRAALWGIIAAVIVLILSGVIVGNENMSAFLTQVIPLSQQWYGHDCNFSLMSIGYRLGGIKTGWLLTITAFIAISLISFKYHGSRDYTYTVGSAGMLIISPLSWLGYGILLFPVLLLLFERISKDASRLDIWIFIAVLILTQFWPFKAEPMVSTIAEYLFYTLPPVIGYMLVIFLACRLLGKKDTPTCK